MKTIGLLITFCALYSLALAQDKMIVFFKDKQTNKSIEFSELAQNRRTKNNVQFDQNDVPVSQGYIYQLGAVGEVLNVSRWLNAVSFSSVLSNEDILNQFTFIKSIKRINSAKSTINKEELAVTKSLDYGAAFEQTDQIGLTCLHDLGYTGEGVYLAVIDAGFINMDAINYFDSVYLENRVLDVHDFVNNASIYDYSSHGTSVSSCIVAEKSNPNRYIGTAKDVKLALYVTEDVFSESEIEEFNLVVGLERCDSVGVEVVNISLGYTDFDDTTTSHVYADFDGITTIAAQGVNIAFTKGIAVSASAGNSGPGTIGTPCDADDCLCIGAIDEFGNYANFSSIGPSADSQVKPDIVARGRDTWLIDSNGDLVQSNGTSFSSPIMAGAIACLVQAHPTRTVNEIFDAIRMSASQFNAPDIFLGYGIPDFCVANAILTNNASLINVNNIDLTIYPVPASEVIRISSNLNGVITVNLYDTSGKLVYSKNVEQNTIASSVDVSQLSNGMYSVELKSIKSGLSIVKQISISK